MLVDVVMPKMGESITEGTVLEWRKKVGDLVEKDELFLEIGTDKVDSEIPSLEAGIIVEILALENDVVDVGTVIARIETDESLVDISSPSKKPMKAPEPINKPIKVEQPPSRKKKKVDSAESQNGKKFYTPVVLKIASQEGIPLNELEQISGSGRGGRVTKKDVLNYIENYKTLQTQGVGQTPTSSSGPLANSSFLPGRTEEMHHMRKIIADHMKKSIETSVHVYVMTEVDMTSIVDFVTEHEESFLKKEGLKLTYTPFIILATVQALKVFPEMNASLDNDTVIYHKQVNIGLAVSVDNGLMVPTLVQCDEKSLLGLCRDVSDIAVRTRNKKISPDELQGSTFTITNFGVFGATIGTPIINQPNVGILGAGAIKKQPVVVEREHADSIAIRSIMMLSLGFDHRLIDGAGGAQFIQEVKNNLETMKLEGLL